MARERNSVGKSAGFDVGTLSPILARRVLVQLLEKQPELKDAITTLAAEAVKNPDLEELTTEIEAAVSRVNAGDVYMNSGRTSRGYREPEEAVGELLSQILEPYFDRLEKLLQDKNDTAGLVLCEAIICALYHARHSDNLSELEETVEEVLEGGADWAARLWRTAGNVQSAGERRFDSERTISVDFVTQNVPEWDWLVSVD
jgi:hypothetical protein